MRKQGIELDWPDYDRQKFIAGKDPRYFEGYETWEVNYLVDKMREAYPAFQRGVIVAAISLCSFELKSPHPRRVFIDRVLAKLGLPLPGAQIKP